MILYLCNTCLDEYNIINITKQAKTIEIQTFWYNMSYDSMPFSLFIHII